MAHSVLVIDDEATLARNIASYLAINGYEAHVAHDGRSGQAAFDKLDPDIVLLDLRLPDISGLEVLQRLRDRRPSTAVIMMTAFGDVETAVDAMKAGAADFLRKPLALAEVKRLVDRVVDQERTRAALQHMSGDPALSTILGESAPVALLKQQIARLCDAERHLTDQAPPAVLIVGETGTGKELVARAIHRGGARSGGPFIEINCAAIPTDVVESELFGHERGAFTDAKDRKIGLIEAADGGTLFLDEIGEMDLTAQAKVLKVMEDRLVRRVGGTRSRPVDVRFVAATNRHLEEMVAAGTFREDLLYRLSVARFDLPPLRDRSRDVLLLAQHFLAELGSRYRRPGLAIAPAAEAWFLEHRWPGNVRELRNVLERAVLFCPTGLIDRAFLATMPIARVVGRPEPASATAPRNADDLGRMELALIERALQETGGNISKAARRLNMSRDQLRYRIEKHGLDRGN